MTRQSTHKHRITEHMLEQQRMVQRVRELSAMLRQSFKTFSQAMAQAYTRARGENT
jgi:hypothetical protein